MKTNQREAYLVKATVIFRKEWKKLGVEVPGDVQVSCGFPGGGSVFKRIGECWPRSRSAAGVNQVFINPTQSQQKLVLGILGHELLHAADDCKSMHGGVFTKNSKLVGFGGGKHSLPDSEAAKALIQVISTKLGAYPHAALNAVKPKQKKADGLQKYECADCGDVLYSTVKKVEMFGAPCCRECQQEMENAARQKQKTVTTV